MKHTITTLTILISTASLTLADWPTYRADNRRSGSTDQTLTLPLKKSWSHQGGAPQQAWTGPAKWDAYAANAGLQSMRNFDPCHYTTISNNKVYYGSSADNAVHCIDLTSGEETWTFFTNSAVRIPPSIAGDKLFFGSDDGFAYALNSTDGKLIWKTSSIPKSSKENPERLIFNNGKTISTHPIRTGVTLIGNQAIFAGSLLPWKDSYLVSVNQSNGRARYQTKAEGIERALGGYNQNSTGATLQGAILTDGDNLFIPQGRAAALKFNAKTGKKIGTIGHAGGTFCLLTEDNYFIAGPPSQKIADDHIGLTDAAGKSVAAFNNTNRVVAHKNKIFLQSGNKLKAVNHAQFSKNSDRKAQLSVIIKKPNTAQKAKLDELKAELAKCTEDIKSSWLWEINAPSPAELIVAGNHLICGYHQKIIIYDATDGKKLWETKIDGTAHGLSVSNGHLIVSTNKGEIISFTK